MLIAHISDTHLGAMQYGKDEREEDFYNAFSEAIDIIIKEHVRFVIHAGDIFDTPRPNGTALRKLLKELMRLEEHDIKFLFVLGEHDIARLRSSPVPFIYKDIGLANYINNNTISIDGISIIGYNKHRLNEIDRLKEYLRNISIDGKKILVLHQGLKEFHEYGELTHLDLPRDFNYYAMGHLHNRAERWFDGFKGPISYPGSTEITAFRSDESLDKGFCLVDLSTNEAEIEWIKLNTRKHLSIKIDKHTQIDELINRLEGKPIIKVIFNDIDIVESRTILRKMEERALHIIPEYIKEYFITSSGERINSIDDAMIRYAEEILGNREQAEFTIHELLPLLLSNKDEASELVWNAYKNGRFDKCLNL